MVPGHQAEPVQELQRATLPAQADCAAASPAGAPACRGEARAVRSTLSLERVAVRGHRPARHASLKAAAGHMHVSVPAGASYLWGRVRSGSDVDGRLRCMHQEVIGADAAAGWRGGRGSEPPGVGLPRAASMGAPRAPTVRTQGSHDHALGMHGGAAPRPGQLVTERFGRAPGAVAGGVWSRGVARGGAALAHGAAPWLLKAGHRGGTKEMGESGFGMRGHAGKSKAESPRDAVVRLLRTAALRDVEQGA